MLENGPGNRHHKQHKFSSEQRSDSVDLHRDGHLRALPFSLSLSFSLSLFLSLSLSLSLSLCFFLFSFFFTSAASGC